MQLLGGRFNFLDGPNGTESVGNETAMISQSVTPLLHTDDRSGYDAQLPQVISDIHGCQAAHEQEIPLAGVPQLDSSHESVIHNTTPPSEGVGEVDGGEDAREAEDGIPTVPSLAAAAQDDDAPETATAVEPSSCHLLCDDRDLPQALKFLEANGFSFHSTNVACPKHQPHLFLVSGVRGGAVPATSEFGTWFVCDTAEEVLDQMVQRLAEMWPGRSLELFSS